MKYISGGAFCVALAAAAFAHKPEGVIHLAWQWPAGEEPVLDGEFWEWDAVPDEFRIPFSTCRDPEGNPPPDLGDLNSNIIVSWSESENKLYVMEERYDDYYDRDGIGVDDTIQMHHDGDHGGEPFWFSSDEYPNEEERILNMGRWAQTYDHHYPDLTGSPWSWFWVSQSTWHNRPEYMDWDFEFLGNLQGEATLYTEFNRVMWDEFIWNDPDASIQTDLEECNIIGLGWMYSDHDRSGTDDEKPLVETWFLSGASDAWRTSASASDFLLAPVDGRLYGGKKTHCAKEFGTAVEERSWGRIKEAFVQ